MRTSARNWISATIVLAVAGFAHSASAGPIHKSKLNKALQMTNQIQVKVNQNKIGQAIHRTQKLKNLLGPMTFDVQIQSAHAAATGLKQALQSHLALYKKKQIANNRLHMIRTRIKMSKLYKHVGGGLGARVYLGKTGKLDKFVMDSESVYVGHQVGRVQTIALRADRNDAFLKEVRIRLGNGQLVMRHNIHLDEDRSIVINLPGPRRRVEKVTVVGTTDGWSGSRAKIEVWAHR